MSKYSNNRPCNCKPFVVVIIIGDCRGVTQSIVVSHPTYTMVHEIGVDLRNPIHNTDPHSPLTRSSGKMHFGSIINDSFGLLSRQLRFYCWHYKRNLPKKYRQELIELLHEHHFEPLANKIRLLNQSSIEDSRQQIGKLLFHHCLSQNRRNQLIQLIESNLVDINVRLDNYGNTLLHRSAYTLDVDLVRLLIKQGANIKLRDSSGNTALHIAIQSYRNGAILYGNQNDVVQNLSSILRLLLDADESLQNNRFLERVRISSLGLNCPPRLQETSSDSAQSSRRRILSEPIHITNEQSMLLLENSLEKMNLQGETNIPKSLTSKTSPLIGKSRPLGRMKSNLGSSQEFSDSGLRSPGETCRDSEQSSIDPILLEDISSTLIDTKNGFGHTALHLCVMVVGEKYLNHFVKLLLSYHPDPDMTDNRMQTPLYCLVKRPGVSAIREKCDAIVHLLKAGCDDLGLAISPSYFSNSLITGLEQNVPAIMQAAAARSECTTDPIFGTSSLSRVPSLKHLVRLRLIKHNDEVIWKMKNQRHRYNLPNSAPISLNQYMNRKILDQSELF